MLRQLGFYVDMAEGKFRVPVDRWEALQTLTDSILSARGGRAQARKLASLAGTVISMRLTWGPVTQLYSRHIYVLVHSVPYLNCWVVLSEEARSELLFWRQLPRLRFAANIWPCLSGRSIRVATDSSDFAWGGATP